VQLTSRRARIRRFYGTDWLIGSQNNKSIKYLGGRPVHRMIPRVALATTCLAAPIASGPALAQFNLYPAGATSTYVPYVNGPMNYVQNGVLMNRAPQLWVRLDAGSNTGTTALFTMDTGSTGIIASSEIFPTRASSPSDRARSTTAAAACS
jgi:hypothetical protein